MKPLLLVTDSNQQRTQFQPLPEDAYTLFTAESADEAIDLLRLTQVDVVVVAVEATSSVPVAWLFDQAKALHPHCVTVYLIPPQPAGLIGKVNDQPVSDFALPLPCDREALKQVVNQALEKQRLLEELAALREQSATPQAAPPVPLGQELSLPRIGQILRDFAKAFSANLNLEDSLALFLEAIHAFLRPSRLSIMVRNPHNRLFEIRAHQGLVPQVADQLRLREDDGLPLWLLTEARILQRSEVENAVVPNPTTIALQREMQALKAAVSFPLMVSGKLVGILNLGDRVTGGPYSEDELDILFSLASNVAVSIQDIGLHQEVQAQKSFTEKILRYMSNGVITIDAQETIRMCNHRGAEMLGKPWSEVVNGDLRSLPSPLGDMLYETLRDGVAYDKQEVVISAAKMPLEISTYQILDDQLHVSGSVMVFQDLTSQKQLNEERRRAHEFDFLNKVAGRMAFEIKNPLVSIQTFIELLDEHYEEIEFREQFSNVVNQDIHTINVITEKLVSLASTISYRFEPTDVNDLLRMLEASLNFERKSAVKTDGVVDWQEPSSGETAGPSTSQIELMCQDELPLVRCDTEQLYKALMYLIAYVSQSIDGREKILLSSRMSRANASSYGGDTVQITLTGREAKVDTEELDHLFDPFSVEQNTLVDVGPCVSQRIIEEHGGHLDVQHEKKGDLTFEILLPVSH